MNNTQLCDATSVVQPYVFHDIVEVLSYSSTYLPKNLRVKVVGVFLQKPHEYRLLNLEQNNESVVVNPIDSSVFENYLPGENVLEVYGSVDIVRGSSTILAHFCTYLLSDVASYVIRLREQRKRFVKIECWNPLAKFEEELEESL